MSQQHLDATESLLHQRLIEWNFGTPIKYRCLNSSRKSPNLTSYLLGSLTSSLTKGSRERAILLIILFMWLFYLFVSIADSSPKCIAVFWFFFSFLMNQHGYLQCLCRREEVHWSRHLIWLQRGHADNVSVYTKAL